MMDDLEKLWKKLGSSKEYREALVTAFTRRALSFQISTLMKQKGLSQGELAQRTGLTAAVVSRALNPEYSILTLSTIFKVAAGLDVAFVGRFVPFSEFATWYSAISEETVSAAGFEEEKHQKGAIG